ncbi:hypothetical protein [Pedobacter punctiformis]|uniref:Uncharacterized protein n=1 Tax=Pedobacter punctiformis TaxID=3004097 RepID=A0ABT4LC01_9SPHI|nr:hypothetical protein [Pedobacter sp. HCMS5-2]MCZ4245434.1 hypothetical protein [Pedobacter sp. HCMS5-2]
MQKEIEITLLPHQVEQPEIINQKLAESLKVPLERIKSYEILKRSIDARSRKVIYRLQVRAFIDEEKILEIYTVNYQNVSKMLIYSEF